MFLSSPGKCNFLKCCSVALLLCGPSTVATHLFMCFSCRKRLLYVKYCEPSRTIKRFGVFLRFFSAFYYDISIIFCIFASTTNYKG